MLTNLSLFSGAGGLDLAAKWTGKIRTVAYVENDPYAQGVLLSRMRDGRLDDAPIFEDVRNFRGTSLRGSIDVVSGGFPCQDISYANRLATDINTGKRSGLWKEFNRIICEVGPKYVLVENVPGLISKGFDQVLGALASLGFDAQWEVLSACEVGAPHLRERVFIIAYPNGLGWNGVDQNKEIFSSRIYSEMQKSWKDNEDYLRIPMAWHGAEPSAGVLRVDDGLAEELDRIRLCGNGVVPQQAFKMWEKILTISLLSTKRIAS